MFKRCINLCYVILPDEEIKNHENIEMSHLFLDCINLPKDIDIEEM